MSYTVKEIFYSLQGEGYHTGRPAVFCRFSGCNLWSGREADRDGAACSFCDTDFVGGTRYASADDLTRAVRAAWGGGDGAPYVICTGGEPLLQMDHALVDAFRGAGFEVGVETNGTVATRVAGRVDWMCVSPKGRAPLKLRAGDELKLVYPQADNHPTEFESLAFRHFFLQPRDGAGVDATARCVAYCLDNPRWRLSLQTHKIIGIA